MLLEVQEELLQLLAHEPVGGAAVSRCRELMGEVGDVLPHLASLVVLQHHLPDGVAYGSAMERGCRPSFFMRLIDLIELWEEHILLFRKMAVQLLKRFGYRLSHFQQLGMMWAMHPCYLVDELHQLFVVKVEVAVMHLQYIVDEQVQRPAGKVWSVALHLPSVQLVQHVIGVEALLLAGCLQGVGAVAAIIN